MNNLLLSIDVGIKNLAMCLVDYDTKKIVKWDVDGVPPQHKDGIFLCMRDHLRERPWVLTANTVVIEKQPNKNRGMGAVENFLHSYFIIHDKNVIIWDAKHKVPDVVGPGKKMYLKRKKTAIERCHNHLKTEELNRGWLGLFESSPKKDDLADTYLQALSYINRREVAPVTAKKKTDKINPRKPTSNQKETKYSKSNLAWLYKDLGEEKFKKSKRIIKDLKRYFKSVEEFKKNLKD